jgi:hypothetical protein
MKHNNYSFLWWLLIFLLMPMLGLYNVGTPISIISYCISLIAGLILVTGIVIIPNDPPHFGLVTRWGKRLWHSSGAPMYMTEGWNWVFLKGIMHKVKLINLSKREIDFPVQTLQTPDGVTTDVPVSIAYSLDENNIVKFLNLGTDDPHKVFENIITDIKEENLRLWSRNEMEEPRTWESLLNSGKQASKLIIEAICDDTISESDLNKVRLGRGEFKIEQFGVILNRLNLKEMVPKGEVYEKALKKKNEEKERDSETYEVETDVMKANKLVEKMAGLGININPDEALRRIMEWKITREANTSMSLSSLAKTIAQAMKGGRP